MSENGSGTASGEESARQRSAIGQALVLGTNMAAGMAFFVLLGLYIDHRRGGGVFWTMCGVALGLVYDAYEAWKVIRALEQADQAEKARKRPAAGGGEGR